MRWKSPKENAPKEGDMFYDTHFLIFPINIGGEVRWLEMATIQKVFRVSEDGIGSWENVSWAG